MILLLNPLWKPVSGQEYSLLPLGLGYIAGYLKSKGLKVAAIDLIAEPLSKPVLSSRIKCLSPDLIGVSIHSQTVRSSKGLIALCRRLCPKARIVAGGPFVSALPEIALEIFPEVDCVIKGDGEVPMLELAKGKPYSTIRGAYFRKADGVRGNGKAERIPIDELPHPAWELFPVTKYRDVPWKGVKGSFMHMITSRGCSNNCSFCSNDSPLMARNPRLVATEIRLLKRRYNIKKLIFSDSTFHLNDVEGICKEIIKNKIEVQWECSTRVDLVDQKMLGLMKRAGCRTVSYGVETTLDELMPLFNKEISISQAIRVFRATRKAQINPIAFFIMGFPGETLASIKSYPRLLNKLRPIKFSLSRFHVFPGTPIVELIKERLAASKARVVGLGGIRYTSIDWRKEPVYYYEENFSIEDIGVFAKKIFKQYHLNPVNWGEHIRAIRGLDDIRLYFASIKKLF
jgi:anaerobic magnesium-protoporphyrin IX monomethyl ester cyclase